MGRSGSDSFLVVPAGLLPGEAKLPGRASRSTFGMCGEMKYLKLCWVEVRWRRRSLFNQCMVLRLCVNH